MEVQLENIWVQNATAVIVNFHRPNEVNERPTEIQGDLG